MANNAYLATALQEAGTGASTQFKTAFVEAGQGTAPHAKEFKTAFDVTPTPFVRRVAVTAVTFRAAFGCMWAAEGVLANVKTANYFLNQTRAWRTRTNTGDINIGDPSEIHPTATWTQAASTYFPSVSSSPNDSSPGAGDGWYPFGYQIFGDYNFDLGTSASVGGPTDYNGVNDASYYTTQAVDGGFWTNAPSMPTFVSTWTQSLSDEDSASGCVSDMRTFLAGLNLSGLWTASPPVVYGNYVKNIYPASDGDYNDPSYVNLTSTYKDFNSDITNLSADRTSGHNYPYDGVYYPISNFTSDEILPGAFGGGIDVGIAIGYGSSIGIIGDASRCRVGFVGSNSSPNESAAGGSAQPICDRIQYQTATTVMEAEMELGYGYGNGSSTAVLFLKSTHAPQRRTSGAIWEIPQSSFTGPFITTQGGIDYCIVSMDSVMLINSDIATLAAAIGATIIGSW